VLANVPLQNLLYSAGRRDKEEAKEREREREKEKERKTGNWKSEDSFAYCLRIIDR
jgi:hypothetical protein